MIKEFLMKQMLKRQLKDMPVDQQEKIIAAVEKNPELFMKISKEVENLTKGGRDQMTATMEVMRKHQAELQKLFNS